MISKMSTEEIETAKNYLRVFNKRVKGGEGKSLKLFNLLLNSSVSQNETENTLEEMVYGHRQIPGTFSRLLSRVKGKILESLIIDVNIHREKCYEELSKAIVDVRKLLTQGQILQDKGLREFARDIFYDALSLAKKHELYDELLIALRLLIDHQTANTNNSKLESLKKLYMKYDQCKLAVFNSTVHFSIVNTKVDFYSGYLVDAAWIDNILTEIRADYKKTGSATVGMYYFFIQATFFQVQGFYKNADKSFDDLLELFNMNPGIDTEMRRGGVLLNKAENEIYLRKFIVANKTAASALKNFKHENYNHASGIELMFYCQFFLGKYQTALAEIEKILPPTETMPENYRFGKRVYLKANCLFIMGDYSGTLRLLNQINPIEEDKEGWNIGVRILTILSLFELDMHDEAASKIQALSTFISTNKVILNRRGKIIYQLLLKFKPSGFDFRSVYLKESEKIKLLDSTDIEYQWKIKSPELVIFNQWFFAKAFKQPFIQKIPIYKIRTIRKAVQMPKTNTTSPVLNPTEQT